MMSSSVKLLKEYKDKEDYQKQKVTQKQTLNRFDNNIFCSFKETLKEKYRSLLEIISQDKGCLKFWPFEKPVSPQKILFGALGR